MWKAKKVLVTGAAGFIGSNLCEYLLEQGAEVLGLDNLATGKEKNIQFLQKIKQFKFVLGDIRELSVCRSAVAGCELVFHQAALGSVPRSVNDPITTNSVNVDGFLNLLVAARDAGIKRVVYATSSSVYGDSPDLPKVEEKIGNPLSPYGVSKLVNELYAKIFADLYGMELIGLRYFNVFGKHQDPDGAYAAAIPKFIKAFLKGESPLIYGDGEQSRDFTYIRNVVEANVKAALVENPEALNKVYNVAFGERVTLNELVDILKENLSRFEPAIAGIEVKYGEERKGEVKHSLASIDRSKKLLGYDPQYSVRQGLEETIEWYVKELGN